MSAVSSYLQDRTGGVTLRAAPSCADPKERVRHLLRKVSEGAVAKKAPATTISHPFPARMPLGIAELIVRQLSPPQGVVVDPMAGSGTTLVAAKALGRVGIGFDVDPLAVGLSRAALTTSTASDLAAARDAVACRARQLLTDAEHTCTPDSTGEEDQAFIDYWFPPTSQRELGVLARAIGERPEDSATEFLWAAFSALIVAKTAGASYAMDLAHTRPHKSMSKKVIRPMQEWVPRSTRLLQSLPFVANDAPMGEATCAIGDARELKLDEAVADLVLTSPPYRQALDYMRAHKFTLVWKGMGIPELREIRSGMIGAERGLISRDGLPAALESRLQREVGDNRARAITRLYLHDIHRFLQEVARILKPGGFAVLVTGPSFVSSGCHDAVRVLRSLAESAGLAFVASRQRMIPAGRRALPPPDRVPQGNGLQLRLASEVFAVFRKTT